MCHSVPSLCMFIYSWHDCVRRERERNMPCRTIDSKNVSMYMKVFFAHCLPLSLPVSCALFSTPSFAVSQPFSHHLMYHVCTFGVLMSLSSNAIGQEERKDAIDDDNEKKGRKWPKKFRAKKKREIFFFFCVLAFFSEWMNQWSLFCLFLVCSFLSLPLSFSIDEIHGYKLDHLFFTYDSLFFAFSFSISYVKEKNSVLLHKI